MLDIAFGELMVIGVVALVVLGPERLPRVARTAGHLLGRFQRYVSEVKADINREIELADLKKLQTSMEDTARSIETSVKTSLDDAQKELHSAEEEFKHVQAEVEAVAPALELPHMGQNVVADTPAPAEMPASHNEALADSSAAEGNASPQMELPLPRETHKHG